MIHYNVNVANTGTVTLTGVTVVDPLTGLNIGPVLTIAVGADADYTSSYAITQTDLDTQINRGGGDGDIDNTATADSNQTTSSGATASKRCRSTFVATLGDRQDGSLGHRHQRQRADRASGDVIHYNVNVANTGTVTLTGVTVVDPLTGLNIGPVLTIAVGADAEYRQRAATRSPRPTSTP